MTLIWYYLGRLDQDSAHLQPGTCLLCWVLHPSLVQELPHQEAWHNAQHCLTDNLNTALRAISGCCTPLQSTNSGFLLASHHQCCAVKQLFSLCPEKQPTTRTTFSTRMPQRSRHMPAWSHRHPFAQHTHQLLLHSTPDYVSKQFWHKRQWLEEWQAADQSRLHRFVEEMEELLGIEFPCWQWTMLNRLIKKKNYPLA